MFPRLRIIVVLFLLFDVVTVFLFIYVKSQLPVFYRHHVCDELETDLVCLSGRLLAMSSLDHDGTTKDIPSYYQPNALCGIRLDGCDDLPLTVQVILPFTPFCMSQVLLVKPIGDSNALKLPPKFILKVYDPRFYPYRLRRADKPWSYAAEIEAAAKRPARRNPKFDKCNTPKRGDAVSWEEFFYQLLEEQFYYESSAYVRLA